MKDPCIHKKSSRRRYAFDRQKREERSRHCLASSLKLLVIVVACRCYQTHLRTSCPEICPKWKTKDLETWRKRKPNRRQQSECSCCHALQRSVCLWCHKKVVDRMLFAVLYPCRNFKLLSFGEEAEEDEEEVNQVTKVPVAGTAWRLRRNKTQLQHCFGFTHFSLADNESERKKQPWFAGRRKTEQRARSWFIRKQTFKGFQWGNLLLPVKLTMRRCWKNFGGTVKNFQSSFGCDGESVSASLFHWDCSCVDRCCMIFSRKPMSKKKRNWTMSERNWRKARTLMKWGNKTRKMTAKLQRLTQRKRKCVVQWLLAINIFFSFVWYWPFWC